MRLLLTIISSLFIINAKIVINCNSSSGCKETVVETDPVIDDDHEFDINCIGDNICNGTSFECPTNSSCIIRCHGKQACFSTFFNATLANNFSIVQGSGGDSVLAHTFIVCPIKGSCSISNITSKYGMQQSWVDAHRTISNNLSMIMGDGTGTDAYDGILNESTIQCPQHGYCNVSCNIGAYSCGFMHLWSQPTTKLTYLYAAGDNSFTQAQIVCPRPSLLHPKNCQIYADGSYKSQYHETTIFAVDSFKQVDLYLNQNIDSENNHPMMYCEPGWLKSCPLICNSTQIGGCNSSLSNSWQCEHSNSPCDNS